MADSENNNRGTISVLVGYQENGVPGEPPIPVFEEQVVSGMYDPARPTGQVYKATHDLEGNKLPFLRRSFISFSFGGKDIEDFGLIAFCDGDSMQRTLSAEFEDITVEYKVLDGETFMGTRFKSYTLELDLVSDDLDQKQLEEFRHWFRGGAIRELILAEHPNRAIMARVSAPPDMSMLPYEKAVSTAIDGTTYTTSTTSYKGTIHLSFQAETPYWYSIYNIIGEKEGDTFNVHRWHGKDFRSDKNTRQDVVKIIYEDGIPLLSMVDDTMYFGEDYYAKIQDEYYNKVVEEWPDQTDPNLSERPGVFRIALNENERILTRDYELPGGPVHEEEVFYEHAGERWYRGARCEDVTNGYWGRISGSIVAPVGKGIDLAKNTPYYFFYPGTAPSPIKLSFTIPIKLNGQGYVTSIDNAQISTSKQSNIITITGLHQKQFEFTTPNVITSYNKVIKYFNQSVGVYWGDLQDTIRDAIRHPAVRETALAVIWSQWAVQDSWETTIDENSNINLENQNIVTPTQKTNIINMMAQFWWKYAKMAHDNLEIPEGAEFENPSQAECFTANFTFDAYFGTCVGDFEYNVFNVNATGQDQVVKQVHAKENVGDMLRSNYIMIEDRNVFNSEGFVVAQTEQNPEWSHKLVHDLPVTLTDFKLEYRTMYL